MAVLNVKSKIVAPESVLLIRICFCFISVLLIFHTTVRDLVERWMMFDESMGHGFLVLAICLYLSYISRAWRYSGTDDSFNRAGLPLFFCSIIWGLANIAGINIIEFLILPLILLFSLALFTGLHVTGKLLIPVAFIYFAIPVWDYLNNDLVDLTAYVVQSLVRHTEITAFIEGNSIFLPFGEILIASGCSGLRYFIVALFLSSFCGYMYFSKTSHRLLLIMMGAVLALLANWLRVFIIILIAHYSEMQSSLVKEHETLGWIVFMIFMCPLFILNYRYGKERITEGIVSSDSSNQKKKGLYISGLLFALCISVGPILSYKSRSAIVGGEERSPVVSNHDSENWVVLMNDDRRKGWEPQISRESQRIHKVFEKNGNRVDLVIASYYKSATSAEILPYIHSIHDMDEWSVISRHTIVTKSGNEHLKISLVNKRTQKRMIYVIQYDVGGIRTGNYKIAKLLQIPAALIGKAYAVVGIAFHTVRIHATRKMKCFLIFQKTFR